MAAAAPDPSPLPPPSPLIPCCPLGSGSFGRVSLALSPRHGALVAVKSSLSGAPHELLSLQNEFHILQSLSSPHVLQCLGAHFSATADDSRATVRDVVLEYMEDGSLADALKRSDGGIRDERTVQNFTSSILHGLAYLHAKGIVHCDIKSQNILLGSSGVKIADFGAARTLGEASNMDGRLRGTPLWMAPEVALGEEPLPVSDIWSLGCTVVEMLQGRPPWEHISSFAAAMLKPECSGEIPPLPQTISAHAKDFLLRCLQRDPEKRWTAEQLQSHPFVSGIGEASNGVADEKSSMKALPSPRSTLDFFHSDCESDWEDELTVDCNRPAPSLRRHPSEMSALVGELSDDRADEWIVVRQGGQWRQGGQVGFMQGALGDDDLRLTKASEVNFASAEFLMHRKKSTLV